jgi:autoinducer 2-degrading protein
MLTIKLEGVAMFAAHFVINVKPDDVEEFLEACLIEAKASVRDEPDCYRFDIMRDNNKERRFHFLEIFKDAQALESHYETPHFTKMWGIIEKMIDGELGQTDLDLVYSSDSSLGS